MDWVKGIGFGLVIWMIFFGAISVATGWGATADPRGDTLRPVLAPFAALVFATYLSSRNLATAAEYGAMWVSTSFILDYLVSTRFDPEIFSSGLLWAGYALVFLAPLATFAGHGARAHRIV